MKTARTFVRKVRSKSPFRSRKRAENLVADIREKEEAYLQQLRATASTGTDKSQNTQQDDIAEIEVVLELSDAKPTGNNSRSSSSRGIDNPSRRDEYLPDLAASSTASTEEPPLTSAQAAARRFMERQQRVAAGNRRKSFRDRFMRSCKNTTSSPQSPSPARSPNKRGLPMRGSRSSGSSSSSAPEKSSQVQARGRGRSRERSARGIPPTSGLSNSTHSIKNDGDDMLSSKRITPAVPIYHLYTPEAQPATIELGSQSRVSELSSPAAMIRQESLGTDSIRGVRQALLKMEMELAAAGDAGKRVPRERIMSALNFVANALHREDQKEALVKELDAWIDESVIGGDLGFRADDGDDDDPSSEDETSTSDDGSSTFDLDAFGDAGSRVSSFRGRNGQGSFQDLISRLGKFFTISDEDKSAVRQALADLLLTEQPRQSTRRSTKGDDESASDEDSIGDFNPLSCNLHDPECEPLASTHGRSWWRHHGITGGNAISLIRKENLQPRLEGPKASSPESKMSVPSPTGKVTPRSFTKTASNNRRGIVSGRSSRRSRENPKPVALKERVTKDAETSVGWNSFDESDFWRLGDRYTIPQQPKSSMQQAKIASPQYKVSYSKPKKEHNRFESEFLRPPKEEDEFGTWDDCLHPAENVKHRRQYV